MMLTSYQLQDVKATQIQKVLKASKYAAELIQQYIYYFH